MQRTVRTAVLTLIALALAPVATPASPEVFGSEIRVPEDVPTLQLAIGRAAPGDTIVLAAGTYPGGNVVPREKHDITIRGVDRNDVVLDGADRRKNGIVVHADGVSILNLSAHNFPQNAFSWEAADRFRASYVTVWNVGLYGIYVEDGEQGVLDNDYVSGAADAAYYVGRMQAVPRNDLAGRRDAVGGRILGHECHRCRDPRFGLGPQRGRTRAEHVCQRGASAPVENDDRRQYGHEQRPGTGADPDPARQLRRDRDRGRRRQRECDQPQPRDTERALRHRRLPHRAIRRVRSWHPRARTPLAPAR